MHRFTRIVTTFLISAGFAVLVIAVILGAAIDRQKTIGLCTAAGGVYVSQTFTHDECWSADGSHRLFPVGF